MRTDILDPECSALSTGSGNRLLLYLISNLISMHCNTSPKDLWPEDYGPKAIELGHDTYDFIVIGSGTAGSVVANRLSANPKHRVLVIEAGGNPPYESQVPAHSVQGSQFDWAYPTISNGKSCHGKADGICVWPAGKLLGGSSAMGGMLYTRGNARDYDDWARKGNTDWSWQIVFHYFKLLEDFRGDDKGNNHGVGGPVIIEQYVTPTNDQDMILRASKELKYQQVDDFVEGKEVGFGYLYGLMQNGRRYSSALAYLSVKRPNLHIINNAVARKIRFDHHRKAKAVTFVLNDNQELTMSAKKEVILSAGTIESPKLLMLSGIGPKQHLEEIGIHLVHDAPVGNNLHDHTSVSLFLRLGGQGLFNQTTLMDAIYNQLVHKIRPQGVGIMNVGAFINTRHSSENYPDIQYLYFPVPNLQRFVARYRKRIGDSILSQVGPNDRLLVIHVVLLKPKARGKVRLRSADYTDKPLIYPNSLGEEQDIKTLVRGIKRQLEFEKTTAFSEYNAEFLNLDLPDCKSHSHRSDAYWMCYMKYMSASMFHNVGTVKMGPSNDPDAVVDERLRVHGVKRLRVIDASIMPKIVSGPTNGPVIMIGEKGADDVLDTWDRTRAVRRDVQ